MVTNLKLRCVMIKANAHNELSERCSGDHEAHCANAQDMGHIQASFGLYVHFFHTMSAPLRMTSASGVCGFVAGRLSAFLQSPSEVLELSEQAAWPANGTGGYCGQTTVNSMD